VIDRDSKLKIIEPGAIEKNYWRDLWHFKELFLILAWRDVSVQYKQSVIGITWAVIRPFMTMIIFTFVFGSLAKLPSEGNTPYALMVFAGMLPWTLFSTTLANSANSLVGNSQLISKVYFPRMIIPSATAVVAVVDFLISMIILFFLMWYYSFTPSVKLLLIPFFVLLTLATSLGIGLFFAAFNVKYRDFKHAIPFMIRMGLYLSPVGFSSSTIPDKWRLLYNINPMVGIINGFRWCILGEAEGFSVMNLLISIVFISFILWMGIRKFRKTEREFADLI